MAYGRGGARGAALTAAPPYSAVHLCNNSVQRHLPNDKGRSPLLPHHNMWTSTTFREYLQKKGRGSVWGSVIYPSMKRAVTHTMKVAQDHVEPRKGSFELYGADFVLGRDFRPWLIEINSSPTMHASTPVTARLCAQVQEDTIKVVVDRKGDRNCDIGNFELLWRQVRPARPAAGSRDPASSGRSRAGGCSCGRLPQAQPGWRGRCRWALVLPGLSCRELACPPSTAPLQALVSGLWLCGWEPAGGGGRPRAAQPSRSVADVLQGLCLTPGRPRKGGTGPWRETAQHP